MDYVITWKVFYDDHHSIKSQATFLVNKIFKEQKLIELARKSTEQDSLG